MFNRPMLNDEQLKKVSTSITEAEKTTDAELVTVLAKASDSYKFVSVSWAGVISLCLPVVLLYLPHWLSIREILITQLSCFIFLLAIFSIPFVRVFLVSKKLKRHRAKSMARQQFLENNLHRTKGATGVLIFVSQAEKYIEIISDHGVAQHVQHDQWQEIIDQFLIHVKKGQVDVGFCECVQSVGELLKTISPATSVKQELPNHLVVLS